MKTDNSAEGLQSIANLNNEVLLALEDSNRTAKDSSLFEALSKMESCVGEKWDSFVELYKKSGLTRVGEVVNLVVRANFFVLALPLSPALIPYHIWKKKKDQEKERLIQEILKRQEETIRELEKERPASKERKNYLRKLASWLDLAKRDLENEDL